MQTAQPPEEYWYRYDEHRSQFHDEIFVNIELSRFRVVRTTPTGVVIKIPKYVNWKKPGDHTRFICKNWHKKWAHPTPEEAMKAFIRRKQIQQSIYENRAEVARMSVQVAKGNAPSRRGSVETIDKWKPRP